MFNPKKHQHQPQHGYFRASYTIPGTDWQIAGHSRAMERTGFYIPQLGIVLDGGIDLPMNAGCYTKAILITHGHSDHCNALPMLSRHTTEDTAPTHILAPAPIIHRLRNYVQFSYSVKVDIEEELPAQYEAPPESERSPQPGSSLSSDGGYRVWRPCDASTQIQLSVGKKGKTPLEIQCLRLFHRQCATVGYRLSIPSRTVKKVRPDLIGSTKKETGINVQAARAKGEEFQIEVVEPTQPKFAFVLDTQVEALMKENQYQSDNTTSASAILDCPVVMIECTYLEDAMLGEARKRAHICWCELLPYVAQSVAKRKHDGIHKTWILVHFSLRYLDEQIIDFFADEEASRITFEEEPEPQSTASTAGQQRRPPDVVLWLDDGPKELFIDQVRLPE